MFLFLQKKGGVFMKLIKKDNLNSIIKKGFSYSFDAPDSGLYLIEISAEAKSWWQNFSGRRSFLKADYLSLGINGLNFPRLNDSKTKKNLFLSPLAWNGNELKGLIKTNVFIINLKKGTSNFKFTANQSPRLLNISIFKIDSSDLNLIIDYRPSSGERPQNGDRRPWLSLALIEQTLGNLNISASAAKYPKSRDDDDLKIIVDGVTQLNENKNSHQDWFWCGKILSGQKKELNHNFGLNAGRHYIEFWTDKQPNLNFIKLSLKITDHNIGQYQNKDLKWWEEVIKIKKYTYRGPANNRDYNRYDDLIIKTVAYWNKEFFNDVYPPDEPLDPNLVKAMIFQESNMGYGKNVPIDVMSMGNPRDNSLNILNHKTESPEHEVKNGKIWNLNYEGQAKVNSVYDSIYWGVRWLYHKAQEVNKTLDKRTWLSWQAAVEKYGPPNGLYINNVWSIYTNGLSNREKPAIKLWTLILLTIGLVFFSYFLGDNDFLQAATFNSIEPEYQDQVKNIEIQKYVKDHSLFFTVITTSKDWWEELLVGRQTGKEIKWLVIDNPPGEQAIFSAKFINLTGFNEPFLEVYGYSHKSTGSFYLYQIKDERLRLVLTTRAVDYKNESHAYLKNFEKYGHWQCDARFIGGRLNSIYEDINHDGISDVKLSGREEIVCDTDNKGEVIWPETQMTEYKLEKTFLWDKDRDVYRLDKIEPEGIDDSF